MDDTTAIANFRFRRQAVMAGGLLENAGIPYVIQSAEGSGFGPLPAGATILVKQEDAARGKTLRTPVSSTRRVRSPWPAPADRSRDAGGVRNRSEVPGVSCSGSVCHSLGDRSMGKYTVHMGWVALRGGHRGFFGQPLHPGIDRDSLDRRDHSGRRRLLPGGLGVSGVGNCDWQVTPSPAAIIKQQG